MAKAPVIDYEKIATDPEKQKVMYENKEVIMKMFTLKKGTLDIWLMEMGDSKFSYGVLNPTHKIVLINIDAFEKFCRWKDETQFKRRK